MTTSLEMSGEAEELASIIQKMEKDDEEALVQSITNEISASRSQSQTAATPDVPTTTMGTPTLAEQTRMILSVLRLSVVSPHVSQSSGAATAA